MYPWIMDIHIHGKPALTHEKLVKVRKQLQEMISYRIRNSNHIAVSPPKSDLGHFQSPPLRKI